jgi:hypothetical protein
MNNHVPDTGVVICRRNADKLYTVRTDAERDFNNFNRAWLSYILFTIPELFKLDIVCKVTNEIARNGVVDKYSFLVGYNRGLVCY